LEQTELTRQVEKTSFRKTTRTGRNQMVRNERYRKVRSKWKLRTLVGQSGLRHYEGNSTTQLRGLATTGKRKRGQRWPHVKQGVKMRGPSATAGKNWTM